MRNFYLCGFLNPTPAEVTFLIPFFSTEGSNESFVQEVSPDFHIEYFQSVNPDEYFFVPHNTGGIVCKVIGDRALFSYKINDLVRFGEAEEIAGHLNREAFDGKQKPFFEMEAASFVGSKIQYGKAFRRAVHTIRASKVRKHFVSLYRLYSPRQDKKRDTTSERNLLQALQEDKALPDWFVIWKKLWRTRELRPELFWIASSFWESPTSLSLSGEQDTLKILSTLTKSNYLRADAEHQIKERLQSMRISNAHESLWLDYVNSARISRGLIEIGLGYLHHAFEEKLASSSSQWEAIWLRLFKLAPELNDVLVNLATRAFSFLRIDEKRLLFVLIPIVSRASSPPLAAVELLRDWVLANPGLNNVWATAFVAVVNKCPEDRKIIETGLRWLSKYPNIGKWIIVWKSLKTFVDDGTYSGIGRDWLEKSSPKMHIRGLVIEEVVLSAPLKLFSDYEMIKRHIYYLQGLESTPKNTWKNAQIASLSKLLSETY